MVKNIVVLQCMELYTNNLKYIENKELLTHTTPMGSAMIKIFLSF